MKYYYVRTLRFKPGLVPELPEDERVVAVLDRDLVPESKYVTVLVESPRRED